MNHADDGRAQLEAAILNYPGFVPDSIDLSAFMDEEQIHRVKNAYEYKDKLLELIRGHGEFGVQTPWESTRGKFEFRPAELTVWSGFKGHGKSLVIGQVFENFISAGQKTFIISPEFPPHRVLYRMLIQSLTKAGLAEGTAIAWLDAVKDSLWIYDQQSSLKPRDIPALCRYAVDKLGVEHILIDSLMKCGIDQDDYSGQKRLVDQVQQVAHKSKVHIHLVAHMKKGKDDKEVGGLHSVKGASEIADLAENVIVVWRNKEKEMGGDNIDSPDCIVKIEAQRNGDGWIGKVPLFFKPDSYTFAEG